jgi:predicted nucleotide-binding protein (sugar kinase/HSP70/actin superfamily)
VKIGIPQALLYYYYYPLWKTLFQELGHEVVLSGASNKTIVDSGIKKSVPEICVPIKVFNGHIQELINQKVDYIYIPRFVSIKKGETFCPKFLGLTDMVSATFPELEGKIISPKIETKREDIADFSLYKELISVLGINNERELKSALRAAKRDWIRFRSISKKGYLISEALGLMEEKGNILARTQTGTVNIGLIGYVYDVYDEFVSMNVTVKLRELGANVYTFEMLDEKLIDREIKPMRKPLFWTFSNKIFGAGLYFYKNPEIDGIIHLTAFGCGPDSFLGKSLEIDSSRFYKPFMTVRVDEHTGDSHLETRIEAFIDMLRKKKKKVEP